MRYFIGEREVVMVKIIRGRPRLAEVRYQDSQEILTVRYCHLKRKKTRPQFLAWARDQRPLEDYQI